MEILKFVNKSPNKNPVYADNGSSGFDLRAWIRDDDEGVQTNDNGENFISLKPLERRMIHTGLYFEIPYRLEIQVRPRSGMAIKKGLTVINTPGTVDSSYTGECCLLMINLSNEDVVITSGERIAQGVLSPVFVGGEVCLREIENIEKETERGSGGFGHTGEK